MKTATVIFNGIKFPYYMVDHSIEWAANNDAGLHALFLHSEEDPDEGYIFPSDLDEAESITDKDDAEKDDMEIIRDYIKLFEDTAKRKDVSLTSEILTDPSLDEILEIAKTSDRVFVDGNQDPDEIFATQSFEMQDLIEQSTTVVERVYDKGNE